MALNDQSIPNGNFDATRIGQSPAGPSSIPTPGSMPISQQETPIVKPNINVQGGGSKGGGIMDGIGGIIGKGIGAIFGGLFNQGGYVNMANGGPTSSSTPIEDSMVYGQERFVEPPGNPQAQQSGQGYNDALALGYLVGAYHQQYYGGTPDSFQKASEEMKQIMMQQMSPEGMAEGGRVEDNTLISGDDLAQSSMNEALGINQTAPQQMVPPVPLGASPGTQGGALLRPQGLAMGGPPMGSALANQAPTLKPGQTFDGEGSVKGPGGPTDDAIPAKLSNGEFVMSAAATQFFGVDKLNQMNEKGKQGFMQAVNQVEQNQQKPPGGPPSGAPPQGGQPPMMPPMAPPGQGAPPMGGMMNRPIPGSMGKPPMMQKSGGPAYRPKSSGYMGI